MPGPAIAAPVLNRPWRADRILFVLGVKRFGEGGGFAAAVFPGRAAQATGPSLRSQGCLHRAARDGLRPPVDTGASTAPGGRKSGQARGLPPLRAARGLGGAGPGSQGGDRSGSGLSEEPVFGVQSGHAGGRAVPRVPSRAAAGAGGAGRVSLQVLADGVADLPFEARRASLGVLASATFLS